MGFSSDVCEISHGLRILSPEKMLITLFDACEILQEADQAA